MDVANRTTPMLYGINVFCGHLNLDLVTFITSKRRPCKFTPQEKM